jgi:hypothetical protein
MEAVDAFFTAFAIGYAAELARGWIWRRWFISGEVQMERKCNDKSGFD